MKDFKSEKIDFKRNLVTAVNERIIFVLLVRNSQRHYLEISGLQ